MFSMPPDYMAQRNALRRAAQDVLDLVADAEAKYPAYAGKVRFAAALEKAVGKDVTGAARLVRYIEALQRAVDAAKE